MQLIIHHTLTFSVVKFEAKLAILPHICNTNKHTLLSTRGDKAMMQSKHFTKPSHTDPSKGLPSLSTEGANSVIEQYITLQYQLVPHKLLLHELNPFSLPDIQPLHN